MLKRFLLFAALLLLLNGLTVAVPRDVLSGSIYILRPRWFTRDAAELLASPQGDRFRSSAALYFQGERGLAFLDVNQNGSQEPTLMDLVIESELLLQLLRAEQESDGGRAQRLVQVLDQAAGRDPDNGWFHALRASTQLAKAGIKSGREEGASVVLDPVALEAALQHLAEANRRARCEDYRSEGRVALADFCQTVGMARPVALFFSFPRGHHHGLMHMVDLGTRLMAMVDIQGGVGESPDVLAVLAQGETLFDKARRDSTTLLGRRMLGRVLIGLVVARDRLSPGVPPLRDPAVLKHEDTLLRDYLKQQDPYQKHLKPNRAFHRTLSASFRLLATTWGLALASLLLSLGVFVSARVQQASGRRGLSAERPAARLMTVAAWRLKVFYGVVSALCFVLPPLVSAFPETLGLPLGRLPNAWAMVSLCAGVVVVLAGTGHSVWRACPPRERRLSFLTMVTDVTGVTALVVAVICFGVLGLRLNPLADELQGRAEKALRNEAQFALEVMTPQAAAGVEVRGGPAATPGSEGKSRSD